MFPFPLAFGGPINLFGGGHTTATKKVDGTTKHNKLKITSTDEITPAKGSNFDNIVMKNEERDGMSIILMTNLIP